MAMKRRSVTVCVLAIFLTWNVMTYMFLARPQQRGDDFPLDVQLRLDDLESELKDQVEMHEKILEQLEIARKNLQRDLLNQNPLSNNDAVDKSKDVVVMQQPQPVAEDPGNGVVELLDPQKVVLPILVIACNRPTIKRNLDQLLKYRPSTERFPIVVSQDCGHKPTTDAIKSYGDKLTLIQQPDLSNIELGKKEKKFLGYYKISRHYKWALGQIFHEMNYDAVVIVEDDLDISPDFFEYFAATFPILHADPTLWCVSAWNDNGKVNMVADDPELLYRTDFFPGLGWMLEKKTWVGIEDKWPKTFWDDWMRHPDQRQDRACIRPEISRTITFGKVGVSKGQYFDKHLKFIKLNEKKVPFTEKDLSYLLKSNYDETFAKTVYGAPLLTLSQVLTGAQPEHRTVRVQYSDKQSFKTQAKALGIMEDLKSGVPRAGYRGVVSFIRDGRRIYFAPPANWNGYDTSWS